MIKKFTLNSSDGVAIYIFMMSANPVLHAMCVLPTCGHWLYYTDLPGKRCCFPQNTEKQAESGKRSSHNSSRESRKPRAMNLINSVI